MSKIPAPKGEPPKLPRWAQIAAGVALLPFSLLCLAGSVVMVLDPPGKTPILATALGILFVLISLWVVSLSVRLLLNRPGLGLLGPFALKASAILFLVLPIGGIFTGYWRDKPLIAAMQAICYVAVAIALWRLANVRKHAV